jgi:hypothetical protein
MKLISRGNTQLIVSAHLLLPNTKNGAYVQLIINLREKWPEWSDCGVSTQHLEEFPQQLSAFRIAANEQVAILMVIPETALDTHLLKNSMRYNCLEKDQLTIAWLSNDTVNRPVTTLAILRSD